MSFLPVRWKLARDLDMLISPPVGAELPGSWLRLSSRDSDLVMMSVDLGLPWGMAE